MDTTTRRTFLALTAAGAGGAVLSACGGSSSGSSATTAPSSAAAAAPSAGTGSTASAALVKLSDVPVGGAVVVKSQDGASVVVAQPTAGQVVAFSAKCTHRGCTVAAKGAQLVCPCHGSIYETATGKVVKGPAPKALPAVTVKVEDGQVVTDS